MLTKEIRDLILYLYTKPDGYTHSLMIPEVLKISQCLRNTILRIHLKIFFILSIYYETGILLSARNRKTNKSASLTLRH